MYRFVANLTHLLARRLDEQRNRQDVYWIVGRDPPPGLSLPKAAPVISGHDHEGFLVPASSLELRQEFTQQLVDEADLQEVALIAVTSDPWVRTEYLRGTGRLSLLLPVPRAGRKVVKGLVRKHGVIEEESRVLSRLDRGDEFSKSPYPVDPAAIPEVPPSLIDGRQL